MKYIGLITILMAFCLYFSISSHAGSKSQFDQTSVSEDMNQKDGPTSEASGETTVKTIPVLDTMRACQSDDDCTLVETICSSCCDYDAIARLNEKDFSDQYKKSCAGYTGPVCECAAPEVQARCIENLCKAINPFEDESGNVSYE